MKTGNAMRRRKERERKRSVERRRKDWRVSMKAVSTKASRMKASSISPLLLAGAVTFDLAVSGFAELVCAPVRLASSSLRQVVRRSSPATY